VVRHQNKKSRLARQSLQNPLSYLVNKKQKDTVSEFSSTLKEDSLCLHSPDFDVADEATPAVGRVARPPYRRRRYNWFWFGWELPYPSRRQLIRTLEESNEDLLRGKLESCSPPRILEDGSRRFPCGVRFCPSCLNFRATRFIGKADFVAGMTSPSALTLTTPARSFISRSQVAELMDHRGRFFRKLAREFDVGGVLYSMELKQNQEGRFLAHFHCIVDAGFIPHLKLRAIWRRISRADIVFIKQCTWSQAHPQPWDVRRVLQYMVKPLELDYRNGRALGIAHAALRGIRMTGVSGKTRNRRAR